MVPAAPEEMPIKINPPVGATSSRGQVVVPAAIGAPGGAGGAGGNANQDQSSGRGNLQPGASGGAGGARCVPPEPSFSGQPPRRWGPLASSRLLCAHTLPTYGRDASHRSRLSADNHRGAGGPWRRLGYCARIHCRLPISGRPVSVWVGALIAASACCFRVGASGEGAGPGRLPISGRPVSVWVGALIAASACCFRVGASGEGAGALQR